MPTTRLVEVKSYVEPDLYKQMEELRAGLRRISRSRFVEDAILERVQRMTDTISPPTQHTPRKRTRAA